MTTPPWSGSPAGTAIVATADFFTPVVDDAYDWGRIAAANALSDVYAMGGTPVVGVNLLGWPRDLLPMELAAEVLRGGLDVAREAGCHVAGGHSVDDPEPKYGMAVTGVADPDRLLRNDAGAAGVPLTLTKPLGIGVLNSRHKATGEVFAAGGRRDDRAQPGRAEAALAAGAVCATDVTGFGLLGHLHKLARASGVTAPDRRGRGAVPGRAPGRRWPPVTSAAAPGATWTGCARTPTPAGSPRTSCCCWPTRRPPAGCWSPARCPATRSSASWSRPGADGTDARESADGHGVGQRVRRRRSAVPKAPRGAARRSRCGTTVYFGSFAEATPGVEDPEPGRRGRR